MPISNGQKENLFLSGGTLYIEPLKNGKLSGEKFDMGATEITLSRDTTTAQAFTKSGGLKQKIAEVVTEENYTMKIKCNSFSPANLAAALGSEVKEVSFKEGELLPSGELAKAETKFVKINAGTNPLFSARLTFIGKPVQGKKVVALIYEASIKMNGELPLMSEEFANMEFEASALKTDEGYYTHFIQEDEGGGEDDEQGKDDEEDEPTPAAKKEKYIVVAVAGQSNSVGYDESVFSEQTHPNPQPTKITQLGYYDEDNLKVIPLGACAQNLQDMRSFGRENKGTKGIHLPLAQKLLEFAPEGYGVLIVPVAYGATAFTSGVELDYDAQKLKPSLADPKGGKWDSSGAYYQTLRDRVKFALDLNKENKFAGVVWCQGENDALKANNHPALFQAMVEQLAQDWAAYTDRTNGGKVDKSIWYVYESTTYWRTRTSKTAQGNDTAIIWKNYLNYLSPSNYVPIAPVDSYTNSVNGCKEESGWVGTQTSSAPASHYGNDAFRDIIAPRVVDKMLCNNAVFKQEANARALSGLEAKVSLYGTRRAGYTFEENGDVIYRVSKAAQANIDNDGGIPAFVFDKSIKSIELENAISSLIIILETNAKGNYTALYLENINATTAKIIVANGEKNLNTLWTELKTDSNLTFEAKDYTTGKLGISFSEAGIFSFMHNGVKWFDFDLSQYGSNLIKAGDEAGVYNLGFIFGWTTHSDNTTIAKFTLKG